jgi:hypothetical protein
MELPMTKDLEKDKMIKKDLLGDPEWFHLDDLQKRKWKELQECFKKIQTASMDEFSANLRRRSELEREIANIKRKKKDRTKVFLLINGILT